MNYSHTYHAGNFADVLKHWVLTLCTERMQQKISPLAIIDMHAGYGRYDLESKEARATQEFNQGIFRLFQCLSAESGQTLWQVRQDIPESLQKYIRLVQTQNHPNKLAIYPGSAQIAVSMARAQDSVHLLELHANAYQALKQSYDSDAKVHIHQGDSYQQILGLLPPKERRGLVIIDPPFEVNNEFDQLATFISKALARFAHGSYLIWYPIKQLASLAAFKERIKTYCQKPPLCIEAWLCNPLPPKGLAATGLLLINPPFGICEQVSQDLPWLIARFSQDPTIRSIVNFI